MYDIAYIHKRLSWPTSLLGGERKKKKERPTQKIDDKKSNRLNILIFGLVLAIKVKKKLIILIFWSVICFFKRKSKVDGKKPED